MPRLEPRGLSRRRDGPRRRHRSGHRRNNHHEDKNDDIEQARIVPERVSVLVDTTASVVGNSNPNNNNNNDEKAKVKSVSKPNSLAVITTAATATTTATGATPESTIDAPLSPPRQVLEDVLVTTPQEQLQASSFPLLHESPSSSTATRTPPVSSPAPLLVAAKRLGTEVRRRHSKRRKAGWKSNWSNGGNGSSASLPCSDSDDESDHESLLGAKVAEMEESERNRHYWAWCYGHDQESEKENSVHSGKENRRRRRRQRQSREMVPSTVEKSWSASRAPPTRSW